MHPSVMTLLLIAAVYSAVVLVSVSAYEQQSKSVLVYHLIDQKLFGETDGSILQGQFTCPVASSSSSKSMERGNEYTCEFISTDKGLSSKQLMPNLAAKFRARQSRTPDANVWTTLGLYSIHSWSASKWPHSPDVCSLPTTFNMAESEESTGRFKKLFTTAFPLYDGNSTTHPHSTVQRTYASGMSFEMKDLMPVIPFQKKLSAAAYVASTCHSTSHSRPLREHIVGRMSTLFRVDSLGSCHRTELTTGHPGTPTLTARIGSTDAEILLLKRHAISQYKFYFAFENTIEPGYVTEKVFDALKSGVIPVYLGDSHTCRKLMPHPNAAIYADDYFVDVSPDMNTEGGRNLHSLKVDKLANYLTYLSGNETAYNEHLAWRTEFDVKSLNPMLQVSWPCRICAWASNQSIKNRVKRPQCNTVETQ